MKTITRSLAMVAILFGGHAVADEAEKENAFLWKPRTTAVTVFKNGLGFFLRQGDVNLRDGWCVADAVPPAAFGTLAVFAHGKDEVVDVIGAGPGELVEFDGADHATDTGTKRARLEGCRHLKVQLTYRQQGTERTAAGRLISVGAEFVVLETDTNNFAVPVAGVTKFQVLEKPLRLHVAADAGQSPAKTTLGMAYLRKGITWIPEYTLKILSDDTAELTLRGTLVNEAEDIVRCDVNFVVGVPHFFHTDYLAPIAVGQMIRTIGANVAPREVMSQIMNRAAIANDTRANQFDVIEQPAGRPGRELKEALGNLPQLEAAGADDFTVYTRKDLTVRRGEKAIVTLFVKKIRYSHIYRWSPPQTLEHFLVLHNDTDTPWTTGPCLAVSQGSPLSEDVLRYVPKGGTGELPVTTAINLATNQQEAEIDRKLKAHEPAHGFFVDLVTLQGELKIRNFGKGGVEVVVAAPVPGKPIDASEDGVIALNTTKLQLLERTGTITWRFKVSAGETQTRTYKYERYVPSR